MSSVTLVHPAKDAGRNEVPFGRDTQLGNSDNFTKSANNFPKKRRGLGHVTLGVITLVHSDAAIAKLL